MRFVTIALLLVLGAVQAGLWLGQGSLPAVMRLRAQLSGKQQQMAAQKLSIQRLNGELADLRDGLEMVEERARADLGMVKPDEILVQYAPKR